MSMGRPKAKINWKIVDEMLEKDMGATTIVRILGIKAEDTLYRACMRDHKMTFSEYRQQKLAEGADKLKEHAYDMAMDGDRALMIFMLKNRAGYADRTVTESNINISKEAEQQIDLLLEDIVKAKKELDG